MEEILKEVYYNPEHPASFGGVDVVFQAARKENGNITKGQVQRWLMEQPTYTLHKPRRRRFKRNRVLVYGIDHQWQLDLVDMQALSRHNKGIKYLLTCIDIFSKYAWVVPLKDKKGPTLVKAFRSILEEGRKPYKLQSDKGGEFINKPFQQLLKEEGIRFFTTQNEATKASVAERFNRTLKTRMFKYFTHKNTRKYVDVLPKIVSAYNHRKHSSIGRPPVDVKATNEKEVWLTLYGKKLPFVPKASKLQVGDKVRLSMATQTFRKGYLPQWTEEIFTISQIVNRKPLVYRVQDYNGENIDGTFYKEELQKVVAPRDDIYKIERILHTRKRGGITEYFVKWLGYPDKFNSYVTDIVGL